MRIAAGAEPEPGDGRGLHAAPPGGWTLLCALATIALGAAAVILPLSLDRPLAESAGWILLMGGVVEALLGATCARSPLGKAALLSGALSALAGAAFVAAGWSELFPLTTMVMLWLFLRSMVLLVQGLRARADLPPIGNWLLVRGVADAALGATLLLSLPIIALLVFAFGGTKEAVTTFGGLLSISFIVAGISLLATALAQRRLRTSERR
ncbi:MAG TPA: DUF308 domain-containing protein [Allosphingosinicella sp.]|nr:DUF308 domain-containing protein [Allosphingosinicella sp.]